MFFSLQKNKSQYICKAFIEQDDIPFVQMFFKQRKFYGRNTTFFIPEDRVLELELWFQRFNWSYEYDCEAPVFDFNIPIETKFFRKPEPFDQSIVTKKLKSYQLDLVDWGISRSRHLIADDPGLGKTLESLSLFAHFYHLGKVDSLLILVRKALPYQWKFEILDFLKGFKEDDILIVDNSNKIQPVDPSKKIMIVQGHIWADMVLSYKQKERVKKKSNLRWNKSYFDLHEIWEKKSPYLIIDECHDYKNDESVRSMSLYPYLKFFDYRTLLTATPAINSFIDWYGQLKVVDPGLIPLPKNVFTLELAHNIGTPRDAYNIVDYNVKEVQKYKQKFLVNVIKRRKKDIPELKTKRLIKTIHFEMSHEQRAIYNMIQELEFKRIKEVEKGKFKIRMVKDKFPYSIMAVDNPYLLLDKVVSDSDIFDHSIQKAVAKWSIKHDKKIEYLDEYFNEHIYTNGEKVILFDNHPDSMNLLAERYKRYNPIVIHGRLKDSDKERFEKIQLFNDKESDCKLAILSMDILSAGQNLNKGGCRRIIYYSISYDALEFRQSLDRTDRADSEEDSYIEILLYLNTLDMFRYYVVDARKEFNDEFLNSEMSDGELFSIMKRGKL